VRFETQRESSSALGRRLEFTGRPESAWPRALPETVEPELHGPCALVYRAGLLAPGPVARPGARRSPGAELRPGSDLGWSAPDGPQGPTLRRRARRTGRGNRSSERFGQMPCSLGSAASEAAESPAFGRSRPRPVHLAPRSRSRPARVRPDGDADEQRPVQGPSETTASPATRDATRASTFRR
jgi:hypothetical protein